jgi:hypothetical protein
MPRKNPISPMRVVMNAFRAAAAHSAFDPEADQQI